MLHPLTYTFSGLDEKAEKFYKDPGKIIGGYPVYKCFKFKID